ncbi:hypothetical protein VTK73DRAFT_4680 [Phialemonium thermophilum]|uniref:Glycerol-3-phosphate acyltransferase n=1 Tax=Phialemonium thermophilum TaxID=223376 RepID=A0ABR3V7Q2_9PEZI
MADGKETPRDAPPDLQIKGDQITLQPSGFVEPPVNIADETKEEQLMKHMARFRSEPLQFLREVSLYVSGTGWRAYDNVIGQPIFYPGFTENMKTKVLSAPLLQARIAKLVDTRLAVEEREGWLTPADPDYAAKRDRRRAALTAQVQQVAEKLTDGMICKFESKTFIRGAYYLVSQLLLRAYHQGIHVSSEEILRLRKVAERAQRDKQSIIFLPCHRSHVDYLSLQLLCYRLGLALPLLATCG